jgi:polar amino acid transport system substrate-binding protein
MVVDDQHGVFVELTRTIAERANLDIEIIVVPVKRALAYFNVQKFDVLFPGLDVYFPPENPPIKSEELITVKHDFVFTRKGTPLLSTLQELEGKRVGITLGYPYARALIENPLIMLEEAPADENNTKKLIAGRIDAFVVEERTGMQAFINTGLHDEMQYDRTSPIAHQNVYYAFQNTDGGKQLAEIVSRTLSEMKADGVYAEIMRKGETAPQE